MAGRARVFAGFAKGGSYFNTYGGNSVSCATALAVLQVIRDENLLENARRSGEHLMRGLRGLAQRHAAIREVRGAGLFIGVELGANAASGLSGAAETRRVVNGLCRRGVLVGSTGREGNVLKIRSPLTLELQHADLLLEALDQTLHSGARAGDQIDKLGRDIGERPPERLGLGMADEPLGGAVENADAILGIHPDDTGAGARQHGFREAAAAVTVPEEDDAIVAVKVPIEAAKPAFIDRHGGYE